MRALRLRRARFALLAVVLLGRLWVIPGTMAQTFTVLRSFGERTDLSGTQPDCQLVQGPDGTLYGTTSESDGGSVFRIRPDGSGFTTLKWFANSLDGSNPIAGLALSEQTLYGTTPSGGASGAGTVFKINTDGTGFAVLKHFAGDSSEGGRPMAALVLSGNDLYGTTSMGGGQSFGCASEGSVLTIDNRKAAGARWPWSQLEPTRLPFVSQPRMRWSDTD